MSNPIHRTLAPYNGTSNLGGSDAMNGLGVQQSKRRGHEKCVLKRLESRRAIRRIVEYGELQIHVLEKAGHSHKFK